MYKDVLKNEYVYLCVYAKGVKVEYRKIRKISYRYC